MFTKVMWATDGSDAADGALPFAKALAAEGGREMIVAHCEEHTVTGKFAEAAARVHANEDELREERAPSGGAWARRHICHGRDRKDPGRSRRARNRR